MANPIEYIRLITEPRFVKDEVIKIVFFWISSSYPKTLQDLKDYHHFKLLKPFVLQRKDGTTSLKVVNDLQPEAVHAWLKLDFHYGGNDHFLTEYVLKDKRWKPVWSTEHSEKVLPKELRVIGLEAVFENGSVEQIIMFSSVDNV
jgi:hypothetical protein